MEGHRRQTADSRKQAQGGTVIEMYVCDVMHTTLGRLRTRL